MLPWYPMEDVRWKAWQDGTVENSSTAVLMNLHNATLTCLCLTSD